MQSKTKSIEKINELEQFFMKTGRRFAIIYESTLPDAKNHELRVAFSMNCDKAFLDVSKTCFSATVDIAINKLGDTDKLWDIDDVNQEEDDDYSQS